MAEIGKNTVQPIVKRKGQILKTVSSPSTSGSKKQVTNIVLDNGVLKASSDNGDTFEDITVKTAQNAQGAYIKPSTGIPESDLASAVQTSLAKADTAYQKPSGGIPKNDLAQDVQTSLGKADTALQSVPIATSTKVGGVKPASKTTEMTQPVGVDGNGALWTKPASGGTTVIANPSAAGTEDLTKLQVANTVYNIPATEIVFSTDAASGAAEVSGFSVEGQNFAFNLQNNNCVIGKTISNPTTGITYIKCTLSGTVSAAGNYFFVNCSGTLTVSGTSAKLFVTGSPSLTISGITSDNWRNVYIDGEASYIARNSNININLNSTVTVASGIKDSKEEKYELLLSIPDNGAHYIVGRGGTTYISPNYDGTKAEYVRFSIDSSTNLKCNPQFGESYFIVTWVRFSKRIKV